MKMGTHPDRDLERVKAARAAIGGTCELFVDANGAYMRKQAIAMAETFAGQGVTWLEEPVTSDDLDGLCEVSRRAPAGMRIAAGEYGYDLTYFRRMVSHRSVDVLHDGVPGGRRPVRRCSYPILGAPLRRCTFTFAAPLRTA